jgi:hypothetical protein
VRTSVGQLNPDGRSLREGLRCVHAASKQAQIFGLSANLRSRLHIGEFDINGEGIARRRARMCVFHQCLFLLQSCAYSIVTLNCLQYNWVPRAKRPGESAAFLARTHLQAAQRWSTHPEEHCGNGAYNGGEVPSHVRWRIKVDRGGAARSLSLRVLKRIYPR